MDKLDLYARNFNFTIKKKNKVISGFGVFLSIITFSIVLTSFFAFGRNFIYKKNPLILRSLISPSDIGDPIEVPHNNLIQFPFRIKDDFGNSIESSGLGFKTYSVKYNITFKNKKKITRLINFAPCSKILIEIPAFVNYYNISDWHCIDFESTQIKDKELFNFIGSQYDNIFQYLKIDLICTNQQTKNGTNQDLNFKNTTDFQLAKNNESFSNSFQYCKDVLEEESNKKIYFEYLFPSSYIAPNSSPDPFDLAYFPYSTEIKIHNRKILQSFLSYDMALDDVGWILEDKRNYRQFNTPYHRIDFSNVDSKYEFENTSPLTSVEIIALKEYILYTRIFMKMQEVAAQIGGLLNTFHVFFQILVYIITDSMRDVLINELFTSENKKKKIIFKKIKTESFNPWNSHMHANVNKELQPNTLMKQNSNIFNNNINSNNLNAKSLSNNMQNNSNQNINNLNNNYLSPNLNIGKNLNNNYLQNQNLPANINNINHNINININNNFNNSNLHALAGNLPNNNSINHSNLLNNFVNPMKSRLEKSKKEVISKKFKKRESLIKINFFDNFNRRFCPKFYDKKKPNLKNYGIMCDYIDSRLDIIFYFKNLIATEKFKTFFLNDYEMRSFDYMGKLNVHDIEEELDIKKQDYYKFLDFFCDKLNKKGIKSYDEKIFNMMSDEILLEINNFNMGS